MAAEVVTLTLNPALDVSTATPRITPAHKLRCAPPRFDPGGGGVNVARVIQRLGGRSLAVYPAGGPTGQRLTALLEAEGARTVATAIAGETRESFTVTDRSDNAEYRFVLPGPVLSDAEQDLCFEAALATGTGSSFLVVSGSLPSGLEPQRLHDLARLAKARDLRLVVDSSGPALAAALEAGVHLVKPNLRELSDLVGRSLPTMDDRLAACRRRGRRYRSEHGRGGRIAGDPGRGLDLTGSADPTGQHGRSRRQLPWGAAVGSRP